MRASDRVQEREMMDKGERRRKGEGVKEGRRDGGTKGGRVRDRKRERRS